MKKGMCNSVYGCIVMDPVKNLTQFTNEAGWVEEVANLDESIEKYNKDRKRFLYYPWGVFVTAYARRNLFMGIKEFGSDYIYSDTDSIKCINIHEHMKFINYYNELITTQIQKCLDFYGIHRSEASPKTIKGVAKPLGVWDWETEDSEYTSFKTLGAKRYIYTQDGELHITIAGLGKKLGAKYIASQEDPYDFFNDEMNIPEENTGKLLHSYFDSEVQGVIIDYEGRLNPFHEKGYIHLEKTGYSLKMTDAFKNYLEGFREEWEA